MEFLLIWIKMEDQETRARCRPGQIGEVCVKSSNLMAGYLNREKETKDNFDADGFGRSEDLGYYDNGGDLYFVDSVAHWYTELPLGDAIQLCQ